MKYEFEVYQMDVEGHIFWVAKSKVLKGCVGQGEYAQEAIAELEQNELEWLETAEMCGIPIPAQKPQIPKSYSGKVSLRFSPIMHEHAVRNAEKEGISLNQYINDAIVYYNGLHDKENSSPTPIENPYIVSISDYKKGKNRLHVAYNNEESEEM